MTKRQFFGTDGVRGRVGDSCIQPEFVMKLGWAIGKVLANGHRKKVLIGKDTRVSGYMLESALEAGLSSAGVDVKLLGPMPTPAIAYLTQTLRANAGIVISASHNLFEDNGIKFFSADGFKLPDQVELAIEKELVKPLKCVAPSDFGKVSRVTDAPGRYIEFCKATIPSMTRLSGLKVVIDCANGATYHVAPNVFSELGAEVISIHDKPDGFNINKNCGSTAPESLIKKVLEVQADVGVGLDGDGDRVILVDAQGKLLNGDFVLYAIACDRQQRGLLNGGVVGTHMSNFALESALEGQGIPFFRAQVGDRYVLDALKKRDWRIGGEPSGHVVCLDKTTTGDAIVAALQVMAVMVKQGKTLSELVQTLDLFPQALVNIKTNRAATLLQDTRVRNLVNAYQNKLQGTGRVLLRSSGTEPVLRVMIEGELLADVQTHANSLAQEICDIDKIANASH